MHEGLTCVQTSFGVARRAQLRKLISYRPDRRGGS